MILSSQVKRPEYDGRVVTLPEEGAVIVCSDLHGNIEDFHALLEQTQLEARLESGEAVYLVITGDVPDTVRHRFFNPLVPEDGDSQILAHLMALSEQHRDHVFYLEGNHDFHLVRLTREVELFHSQYKLQCELRVDGRLNPQLLLKFLGDYRSQFGELLFRNNVAPYDMLTRVTASQLAFLSGGPILAVLPRAKVLITHAGPLKRKCYSSSQCVVDDIKSLDRDSLLLGTHEEYYQSPFHQLLNHRFPDDDYDLEDLAEFLTAFDVNIMVTGHTPLSYLGTEDQPNFLNCKINNDLGWIGQHQAILCTSFGALRRESKVYLELDLAHCIDSLENLRSGIEIRPIYPTVECENKGSSS
jgi:hypothetical protein